MRRAVKSKIEYFSILNPNKVIRAWNKHKAAKKLKTEVNNIREKRTWTILKNQLEEKTTVV